MSDTSKMTKEEKRQRIDELKKNINIVTDERNFAKAMQLGIKLVLNGVYGFMCHPAAAASSSDIANSITALAREVINYMLDNIENYFYEKWHLDEIVKLLGSAYIAEYDNKFYFIRLDGFLIDKWGRVTDNKSTGVEKILHSYNLSKNDFIENDIPEFNIDGKIYKTLHKVFIFDNSNGAKPIPTTYVIEPDLKSKSSDARKGVRTKPLIIYGDTDSLCLHTPLTTDKEIITIEELYNKNISTGSAGITLVGHESVLCNDKILNWSKQKGLYFAPIKRVIRHKVTKQKWILKTKSGKEIFVTNDHSMVVFRNGEKLVVKPSEILKTDKILTIIKNNKENE